MSANWVAVAVLPLVFFLVIAMECSRLHCTRIVQRRLATPVREEDSVDD